MNENPGYFINFLTQGEVFKEIVMTTLEKYL